MVEKTRHEPGSFCWVELATSDGAAAKKFYTSLFGWSVSEFPVGENSQGMMAGMLKIAEEWGPVPPYLNPMPA
ncbi:MAG TPA: VOC family protein [Thermoanaerobaculia bacterium]